MLEFIDMELKTENGFSLIELLVVFTIIAIISAILVIFIDPIETLEKARDSQRISDLAALKSAFGLSFITSSSMQIDGISGVVNDKCDGGTIINKKIWVSVPTAVASITDTSPAIGFPQFVSAWVQPETIKSAVVSDGTGWIPMNFNSIIGGSPISNLPFDPVNVVKNKTSSVDSVTNDALMYRYACRKTPLSYEIDTKLESRKYTTNDNRGAKDGGNNAILYEVGTDLTILPSTNDY